MNNEQITLLLEDINSRLESLSKMQAPDYRGEIRQQTETIENLQENYSAVEKILVEVKKIDGHKIASSVSYDIQDAITKLTTSAVGITKKLNGYEKRQAKFIKFQIRYYSLALALGLGLGIGITLFGEYMAVKTIRGCEVMGGNIFAYESNTQLCGFMVGGKQ